MIQVVLTNSKGFVACSTVVTMNCIDSSASWGAGGVRWWGGGVVELWGGGGRAGGVRTLLYLQQGKITRLIEQLRVRR